VLGLVVCPLASLYPTSTQLGVGLAVVILFAAIAPFRSPRPVAVAAMGVFVAVWMFAATLVWATGGGSKLRSGADLTPFASAALLAVAVVGALAAAGALRLFARQRHQAGRALVGLFTLAFVVWSAIVRYSVVAAVLGLGIGLVALADANESAAASTAGGARISPANPVHPAVRIGLGAAAVAAPALSGLLLHLWLTSRSRGALDPCGSVGGFPAVFILFPGLAAGIVWGLMRVAGRTRQPSAAVAIVVGAAAVAVCAFVFIAWFGVHHCGE
jgi:hypothetical protein